MNIKIFEYIVQAIKNIAALCNKLVDAGDAEKYAEGVQNLNQSVDETYTKMREIILNDDTLSSEQKLEKLEKIANSQLAARKTCEEAINGNRENISKVVREIFFAFTTCGLSYIPKAIKGRKKNKTENLEEWIAESERELHYIEEKCE